MLAMTIKLFTTLLKIRLVFPVSMTDQCFQIHQYPQQTKTPLNTFVGKSFTLADVTSFGLCFERVHLCIEVCMFVFFQITEVHIYIIYSSCYYYCIHGKELLEGGRIYLLHGWRVQSIVERKTWWRVCD